MPEREDLYRNLQVDPTANPLVIQAAYRVLARIFHPDVEGDGEQSSFASRRTADPARARVHTWSSIRRPVARA